MSAPTLDSPSTARLIRRWVARGSIVALVAGLVLLPTPHRDQDNAIANNARGSFVQSNSRAGGAIFHANGLRPGKSTWGSVSIANRSKKPAYFVLAHGQVVDRTGPYRGRLSRQLDLRLDEHGPHGARSIYRGKLGDLRPYYLGVFKPREKRSYRFQVSFPEGGLPGARTLGDNRFMSSSVRIEYDWSSYDRKPNLRHYVSPRWRGPRVKLSTYRFEDAFRRHAVTFMVSCDERCSVVGDIRLVSKSAHSSTRLVTFRRTIELRHRAKLRMKLSKKSLARLRKQFRHGRKGLVVVNLRATNVAGGKSAKRVRVHLKRVRRSVVHRGSKR